MDETSQPIEMLLSVARDGRRSLGAQIETQLRGAIRAGRLAAGARVPSTRDLASQLGVSRRVVVDAYAQLAAEGYLTLTGRLKELINRGGEKIGPREIDEVLLARIAPSGHAPSSVLKIPNFSSLFSVAASMTRSAFFTASSSFVARAIRPSVACLSSSLIAPFLICRSRFLPIVDTPRSIASSLMSTIVTLYPVCAKTCAMPLPMVPAPITTTF